MTYIDKLYFRPYQYGGVDMRFFKAAIILSLLFPLILLSAAVSAEDEILDIYIDKAEYNIRADIAAVNVDVSAYLPYGAAEGTFIYDPDLLTLKTVKYNKQALLLSYSEDKSSRGVIRICCYGREPMEEAENIRFVFNADVSFTGTSQFALGEFTLCDSEQNITILSPDVPLELKFEKGTVAEYSYNDTDDIEENGSTNAASRSITSRRSSHELKASSESVDATANSSRREKEMYYFHKPDTVEIILIYIFLGIFGVILISSLIRIFRKKNDN